MQAGGLMVQLMTILSWQEMVQLLVEAENDFFPSGVSLEMGIKIKSSNLILFNQRYLNLLAYAHYFQRFVRALSHQSGYT